MLFQNATALNTSPPAFALSRLFAQVPIKPCHLKFGGLYSSRITYPTFTVQSINILYRNGLFFAASSNENAAVNPVGDTLGTWDCTDSGTLTINLTYFQYKSITQINPIIFQTHLVCVFTDGDSTCTGTNIRNGYMLNRPSNGTFDNSTLLGPGEMASVVYTRLSY